MAWIGHEGDGFAFDNESPRHKCLLQPFRIASRPVSNARISAFIADGGYRRPNSGSPTAGRGCRTKTGTRRFIGSRTMTEAGASSRCRGVPPLDPNAPVEHVSFYEAAAFAAWAGARLPTEFEWEARERRVRMAKCGNGPAPPMIPIRLQAFEGVAAEYNGKFMVGQMVLRGGSARRRPAICVPHIAISSRRRPVGNFPASGWRRMHERACLI